MRTSAAALVFALLSLPNTASAADPCEGWFCDDPGKYTGESAEVVLRDGAVKHGKIIAITTDHVVLSIAGAKLTLAWDEIASFSVGAEEPAPEAVAPPTVVVIEEKPAPVTTVVVASAPPPVPIDAIAEPVAAKPVREPGPFTIGARAKLMTAIGDARFHNDASLLRDFTTAAVAYEVSFALRLNEVFWLRAAYEHAEFQPGERNSELKSRAMSDAVGFGVRALFGNAPDVRGIFEAGAGYRWMHVPYGSGAAPDRTARRSGGGYAMFEGVESLRAALGTAYTIDRFGRFELLLEGALGQFARVQDNNTDKGSYSIPDSARTQYAFCGISLGLELGL